MANMVKGEKYWTTTGEHLVVLRVARDGAWADVQVVQRNGATWRKRQPLRDGEFPFTHRLLVPAN